MTGIGAEVRQSVVPVGGESRLHDSADRDEAREGQTDRATGCWSGGEVNCGRDAPVNAEPAPAAEGSTVRHPTQEETDG